MTRTTALATLSRAVRGRAADLLRWLEDRRLHVDRRIATDVGAILVVGSVQLVLEKTISHLSIWPHAAHDRGDSRFVSRHA